MEFPEIVNLLIRKIGSDLHVSIVPLLIETNPLVDDNFWYI